MRKEQELTTWRDGEDDEDETSSGTDIVEQEGCGGRTAL